MLSSSQRYAMTRRQSQAISTATSRRKSLLKTVLVGTAERQGDLDLVKGTARGESVTEEQYEVWCPTYMEK